MQHKDMLPFLSTSVLENGGNEKSYFFVSVPKNATEGIFRFLYVTRLHHISHPNETDWSLPPVLVPVPIPVRPGLARGHHPGFAGYRRFHRWHPEPGV